MARRITKAAHQEILHKFYHAERNLAQEVRDHEATKGKLQLALEERNELAAAWDDLVDCRKAYGEWIEIDKGSESELATIKLPKEAMLTLNRILTKR